MKQKPFFAQFAALLSISSWAKVWYDSTDVRKIFPTIEEMNGEEPKTEPYVVYNDSTLTFYCDNKRSSRLGTTYDLNRTNIPRWREHSSNVTKAVFDASFADARPTTTCGWFGDCSKITCCAVDNRPTLYAI